MRIGGVAGVSPAKGVAAYRTSFPMSRDMGKDVRYAATPFAGDTPATPPIRMITIFIHGWMVYG